MKMLLCGHCIEAIRSRGEKLLVGDIIDTDEKSVCDWCDETDDELYECEVK